MPSNCVITLDRENATYFTGETITGSIVLETSRDKIAEGVCVMILGEGYVKFSDFYKSSREYYNYPDVLRFTNHEVFTKSVIFMQEKKVLAAGTYNYQFSIPISEKYPQSSEYSYGNIGYEVILKITNSNKYDNFFHKPITILYKLDLNANASLKLPALFERIKPSMPWHLSEHGTCFYSLEVPCRAFVPGQSVNYVLKKSNHFCEGHNIHFYQKVIFIARSPFKKQHTVKKALLEEQCSYPKTPVFQGEFSIPPMIRPTETSSLISVEYVLRVSIKTVDYSFEQIEMPIVIGTIPFEEHASATPTPKCEAQQHGLPSSSGMISERAETAESLNACEIPDSKPSTLAQTTRPSSNIADLGDTYSKLSLDDNIN